MCPERRRARRSRFPTKPAPFDRQGVSIDDLIDFTPELRAQAMEVIKKYKIGPIFTPPALARPDGPLGTLMLPMDVGGANWPGGSFDPATNRLYIHSHTTVFTLRNVPAELAMPGPNNTAGMLRPATEPGEEEDGAAPVEGRRRSRSRRRPRAPEARGGRRAAGAAAPPCRACR